MFIEVHTSIFLDVKDKDQAEAACSAIDSMLDSIMNQSGFPHGEVVQVDVDHYEEMTPKQISEKGFEE